MRNALVIAAAAIAGCGGSAYSAQLAVDPPDAEVPLESGLQLETGSGEEAGAVHPEAGVEAAADTGAPAPPEASAPEATAPETSAPETSVPACSPATCPIGCCSPSGQCVTDVSSSACGSQGGACEECADAGPPLGPFRCAPIFDYGDAGAYAVGGWCCSGPHSSTCQ